MTESLYPHVIRSIMERPWAILPETLATIVGLVRMRAAGERLSPEAIGERLAAAAAVQGPRNGPRRGERVAVLPIYGVLMPKANLMSQMSGGTSVEQLQAQFRKAMADPEVGAVVFDVDSPGGQVDGIPELAAEIRAARGRKPMIASANTMAASAAHWLASQADEFTVTPSGVVGSVGVIAAHSDFSKAEEMEGIKTTFMTAGKFKAEGNPHEPLGEEARASIQADVDAYYRMFVDDLAKARSLTAETVRKEHGEGRTLLAEAALKKGMVDRIETLDQAITRAGARAAARGGIVMEQRGAALGTEFTFGERLELVAAEVEAIAHHAQERADWRAVEGRKLSEATRDGLRRLLALRPILDDVEGLIAEPATAARSVVDLAEAYRRGYAIDDMLKGMTDG
jgi:signal peptide peptidase SppA